LQASFLSCIALNLLPQPRSSVSVREPLADTAVPIVRGGTSKGGMEVGDIPFRKIMPSYYCPKSPHLNRIPASLAATVKSLTTTAPLASQPTSLQPLRTREASTACGTLHVILPQSQTSVAMEWSRLTIMWKTTQLKS
jgi:hypothetical protein